MGNQSTIKKKSSQGFRFKQFYVAHDKCAMKVGTDGVLLGAWCPLPEARKARILDVGTGSGLIALMLAQRCPEANIDAIDIDPNAIAQAEENFSASPWADRLRCKQSSLQDFAQKGQTFDLIVSNPPYFVNSLKNPDEGRTLARHTDTLSYKDLISYGFRLLNEQGIMSLILPVEAKEEIIQLAKANNLCVSHLTTMYPKPDKPAKRILINLSKQTPEDNAVCNNFYIESATSPRSSEYADLTEEFYL